MQCALHLSVSRALSPGRQCFCYPATSSTATICTAGPEATTRALLLRRYMKLRLDRVLKFDLADLSKEEVRMSEAM